MSRQLTLDELSRFWSDLAGRLSGPLTFRLVLQPSMAALLAIRDGLRDARQQRPAYLWALFTMPGMRRELLRDGWKALARLIVLGFAMDLIYQLLVFEWVYLGELVVVVLIFAVGPYVLLRGPIGRLAKWGWYRERS